MRGNAWGARGLPGPIPPPANPQVRQQCPTGARGVGGYPRWVLWMSTSMGPFHFDGHVSSTL